MTPNILKDEHPLVQEAWKAGFNPGIKENDVIVSDKILQKCIWPRES